MSFVHLHVHSHYSLLDGLPKIDELVAKAKDYGCPGIALTDHGVMYGIIEFYSKCKSAGIKPIIGFETYIAPRRLIYKKPKIDENPHHLVLLAKNNTGYKNLLHLCTVGHLDGFYYKPRIDKDVLRKHSEGIIASTACLGGEVPGLLNRGQYEEAKRAALEYNEIFGQDNFYLELQHIPGVAETLKVNDLLIKLSKETNIPLILTTDAHYINEDDQEAQDALVCINTGTTLDSEKRLKMSDFMVSLADPKVLAEKFSHVPEALENTVKICEACNVELDLKSWNFPEYQLPPGREADEYLTEHAYAGYEKREGKITDEAKARLDYELDIIQYKGYSSYFLIVADFMNWARSRGIIATTRGSASGSLVSYALGVTTVNPLKFFLPFERFLNKSRPSPPDIDCDIQDDRRDEIIEYVKQKYGRDKVAQVCTFGTMMAKAAVRDVTRVLGLPYTFGDKLAKMIPMKNPATSATIEEAKEISPEIKAIYKSDPQARRVLDLAQKIEGCARHVSIHAAATIISPKTLTEFIPLQRDPKKGQEIVTQYDMYALDPSASKDSVGLLKMDFLGIRNLSILGIAIDIIKHTKNVEINIDEIPWDDKKSFDLLARGRTLGVFQLASSGMTRYIMELKPTSIKNIMAMIALYRPGPMESIPEFIARKQGRKPVVYLDPRLEKILNDTYGVITYQDDVLLIAIELAGYTWENVDKFRKAIGKKIPELMAEQEKIFVDGCQTHGGLTPEKSNELWKLFDPFKGYGFNKAHASSYAVVAYQTAYLKANYPAEFMSAMMTAEARNNNTDKVAVAVKECEFMGIKVLPPDVNASLGDFTYINDSEIRFGLKAVKNLGSGIIKAIIKARKEGGLYQSLEDFLKRVKSKDLNKKSLEALIKSGAMDSLGNRSQLFNNVDLMLNFIRTINKEAANGQTSLFGALPQNGDEKHETIKLLPSEDVDNKIKLSWEKELLGLYVSDHPFVSFEKHLSDTITFCSRLKEMPDGTFTNVGGVINKIQKIFTKKQELMLFVTIEDTSSSVEVLVFPKTLEQDPDVWQEDKTVLVRGRVSDKDGTPKILAEKGLEILTENISEVKKQIKEKTQNNSRYYNGFKNNHSADNPIILSQPANKINSGQIWIQLPRKFNTQIHTELKNLFQANSGGCQVYLTLNQGGSLRHVETSWQICWHDHLHTLVEKITGPGSITIKKN